MVPGKDDSMEVVSSEVVEDGAEKDKNGDNALVSLDLLSLSEVLAIESSRKTFMSLMIGDFICNYSDGVFIGSAFSQCNPTLGWTIALATILHELPQELADAGIWSTSCAWDMRGRLSATSCAESPYYLAALP